MKRQVFLLIAIFLALISGKSHASIIYGAHQNFTGIYNTDGDRLGILNNISSASDIEFLPEVVITVPEPSPFVLFILGGIALLSTKLLCLPNKANSIGSVEDAASDCPQNRAYGSVHGSSRKTDPLRNLKPMRHFPV